MKFTHSEEFLNRNKKLQELKTLGIDPYPPTFTPTHTAENLQKQYGTVSVGDNHAAAEGKTPLVFVAGRLMLFRPMGKNIFAQLQDGSGRIQLMLNKDCTEFVGLTSQNESLSHTKTIEKLIDLGDILGAEGFLFHTMKGELTILVTRLTLLTKSLLSIPEKHAGLTDKETRYRKRWLDLISNQEVRKTFIDRSNIIKLIRHHLDDLGFIEVETPVLGAIYGGAEARPFTTQLHALKQDMFLRISPEINLKKLLVGGLERIFEIGKVFRNEGIDRTHNPEFTMLECYAAYWDYTHMMHLVETMIEKIAISIHNTTEVPFYWSERGETVLIDFKAPWKRMTMKESIQTYAQIDCDALTDNQMRQILRQENIDESEFIDAPRGLLIAHLFETKVEHHLIQPHLITDHPIETTPLCRPHRNPHDRSLGLIERFEGFILGSEICNAYSELNDPEIQKKLLEYQVERREKGDEEASPFDEEFVEALYQGMPPAGGLGIGIDRIIMLLTNSQSIRDVLFFPWMK